MCITLSSIVEMTDFDSAEGSAVLGQCGVLNILEIQINRAQLY
jgi:hypothetical protein